MSTKRYYLLSAVFLLGTGCGDETADPAIPATSTGSEPGSTGVPNVTSAAETGSTSSASATSVGSGMTSTGMSSDTTSTGDPATGSSGADAATDTEAGKVYDCDDVPVAAISHQLLDGARGYHGLVIVPDGRIIGSDGTSLIAATYGGLSAVLVPGIGSGQQIDRLPDGDLAFASGGLTRVRLDGTTENISGSVYPYGVVVGPDGMIYAVDDGQSNGVVRVDPETGTVTQLFFASPGAHSLGFSPDWSRMYMGTVGGGTVYYADVDENLTPTMEMAIFAQGVGNWQDAVAVDACGNLYVPDYNSRNIYRITPGGDASVYWIPPSPALYGHALIWGTGAQGWQEDALYMPNPYNSNTVSELVIGVPGREFEGTVLNAPAMK